MPMTQSKAIHIQATGGPEVLTWTDVAVGAPAAGELLVRHTAVGLNFIDTYQRAGLYPLELPTTLGLEAAGVVEAVGEGVADFAVGDRIAYCWGPPGAYAQARTIPADRVVKLPDAPQAIDDRTAAAMMLKGCTVEYLIRQIYAVQPGQTVLFHAAAGGVGLIACQWLKHLGATVIGTVGSDEKADLARAHGCDHPIVYTRENFVEQVRDITDGAGVPVVYDSIGADTFEGSLDCLAPRGLLVSFGNATGPVTGVNLGVLAQKGSLYVTRPTLFHYNATPEQRAAASQALFDVVTSGAVRIAVNQTYPLADTAQAHRDLEARRTTGSTVLLP